MKLSPKWKGFLSFLKIEDDKAEATELSLESIDKLDAEMSRLKQENALLVSSKKEVDDKLNASTEEVARLKAATETKDAEINTLKSSLESKETEIAQLKEQVKNLKNSPANANDGLSPKREPESEDSMEDLAAFCDKHATNYDVLTDRLKQEGLI